MKLQKKLLIATNNPGKTAELHTLLGALEGVSLVTPSDLGIDMDVAETGQTYYENAVLKARAWFDMTGLPALADDSGLEVDALEGAPGVYSARFGGVRGAAQHHFLLNQLVDIPEAERTARFRAVVVVVDKERVISAEGIVEGRIGYEPIGEKGFGYDPLFFIPDEGKTMAELPSDVKNQISHRAMAIRALMPDLMNLFAVEE